MARVKYSEEAEPLNDKHFGFTFQKNHYGHSMQPASRSARFRRPRQHNRQHNNQKAITQWRNMSVETKAAWNLFAATYQQPSKRQSTVFLTGYQLFLKRNSYCFLNNGIMSDFMISPTMEELTAGETIFELTAGDNVVDLTELYMSNFGIIPNLGQSLLFCAIPYSDVSGQFFAPIFDTLIVEDVYFDGFFLNLIVPPDSNNIVYSIYLSKPVSAGQAYAGTKTRYMGCFTTKKFTSLSDVPAVTPADAGKTWGVNPDGTLGWLEGGGGGGLTCEDLAACPTIISIEVILLSLAQILIPVYNVSIPAVKYGLLYNRHAAYDSRLISTAGWRIPTWAPDANGLQAYLGGLNLAGAKLKETGTLYWLSDSGTSNLSKFNARGSGYRDETGVFQSFKARTGFFTYLNTYVATQYYFTSSNNTFASAAKKNAPSFYGISIRFCKTATGIADGVIGIYQGNNGRIYRTIVINQIEWMADSLAETHFSDGSLIPEVTDNSTWAALLTPALCAPENNWSNV